MSIVQGPKIAIVDYGVGNLFSLQRACERVGIQPVLMSSSDGLRKVDAILLPGVGAFGRAMDSLRSLDLVSPLQDWAAAGRPLVGICLGMQLLMSESQEFGCYRGLDILPGTCIRLKTDHPDASAPAKVPHVGWNLLDVPAGMNWSGTQLGNLPDKAEMYFAHSFHVIPNDAGCTLSTTVHGDQQFCSTLCKGNVFGAQYHPERSGPLGLRLLQNIARQLC